MAEPDAVILERLTLLDDYVSDLRSLQDVDYQTYAESKLIHRTVERTLHLAVEACLDIGQHLIAQEGLRRPADNPDVFVVLVEEQILPDDLRTKLTAMARFRNLIVHDYARIDNQVVFAILKKRLDDFDQYARAILVYLESQTPQ